MSNFSSLGQGERNITADIGTKETYPAIELLGKALSSVVRLEILDILRTHTLSIGEIAQTMNIAISSAAFHINILEQAGLVLTRTQPGVRGAMRVCVCSINSILISTDMSNVYPERQSIVVDMPIGHYTDCDVRPTCGIANENGVIGSMDDPRNFFRPDRTEAQLIWFQEGFVEYRFPNYYPCIKNDSVKCISFRLELCSEAPGFRDVWPSDISIYINRLPAFAYHSPGDFGSRRGALTPIGIADGSTQFGLLKTFSIRQTGAYLDDQLVSIFPKLDDLKLNDYDYITFRIGIDPDAKTKGGINIFGKKYGDFPQNITMTIDY